MRGKRASGTKHARIRETIYRIFEHGNAGLWTMEHISLDLLRDFSKELRALFASVNSLSEFFFFHFLNFILMRQLR